MSGGKILLFGAAVAVSCLFLVQPARAQITDPSEVAALKAIRNKLSDPMNNLRTWSDGDPCSSNWKGVICFNSTLADGYLHVEELQLLKMNFSGSLAPEFGQLSYLKILDVMWNQISGSIPKEIGSIKSLKLLLLNGNQLSGPLPVELGYLPNLDRIQIDTNNISGPIPKSFALLNKTRHFHMNNNSLSGQIPPELSRLPSLVHLLLDNNNLTGFLPPELSRTPSLLILQLDNNNFSGASIPASYGGMAKLLKMSLRNCNLQGEVPDLSSIPQLGYLDLSQNQLTGNIPSNKLSNNITTIDLSSNSLTGPIPENFSRLPNLQRLSLENNHLIGSVPTAVWKSIVFTGNRTLLLDFQNNNLTNISTSLNPPANVSILLYGNPVCSNANQLNIEQYCQYQLINQSSGSSGNSKISCGPCPSDQGYEYNPLSPLSCFCSIPLEVGYRLKSPGFSNFLPYMDDFDGYLSSGLELALYQVFIDSFIWEEGPRLRMKLKLFPNNTNLFNDSEVLRIRGMFTGWLIPDSGIFGPYELLNFTLGFYSNVISRSGSRLSAGAVVGIVLASVALAVALSTLVTIFLMRRRFKYQAASKRRSISRIPIKVDGVKGFTFEEMALATNNFSSSSQVGQGGYGKVYRGILADGTVVAIKRALEGSLQGSREFFTEIELLSRLHHRNLVSLVGYCDEENEQMLVYEFMPNGTLRDHLSAKSKEALSFAMRLSIALGSARGILYLHTEADPPIFHRDIKASNILLDSRFVAKVADFGLSRLAPAPNIEGDLPGHVSTVVKGTPGYLDPEYFLTHKLTDKSDVYSLGVVFLELLTGRQPILHGKNIVREVTLAYQSGMIFSAIDSRMGSYPSDCVEKFISLALRCCQDETDSRPSMPEVVRELDILWRMTPETDTSPLESVVGGFKDAKAVPESSSLVETQPYVSSDVSGSNLISSVIPPITPR
ncbi:probable LRR receptor-like serine/threonine-protein kinase At1g06840 [Phalaenopsis equestris]|uniref:probable LRR receptor-like serine/threonine-protein kinase At1g06840 n=1 Tax=Phalaenopsis equestris TaxID=78828 RepID=UPI0009E21F20|nr:probable LRR receptor-like serine/threonine-protein kinase At1g06840 [Phalaenopsis equestris]XP_020575332.1 probable LRR receptor-like serine/threonine-protein kinase At1g06840 [Phalaenopsis equestris]XP_020575338.1 probable LRR receptor-like serine/threonine-protein kinase At1g06840 [Phalaenopsis equestris]XP_020575347.1 probable LRR receptor-like serine/threonine-protein kinase At1g06840 [Phalaenopsis equestris]XP_020575356.1 probable LRR receptor-like serine/threonine-protein kinase At1g0